MTLPRHLVIRHSPLIGYAYVALRPHTPDERCRHRVISPSRKAGLVVANYGRDGEILGIELLDVASVETREVGMREGADGRETNPGAPSGRVVPGWGSRGQAPRGGQPQIEAPSAPTQPRETMTDSNEPWAQPGLSIEERAAAFTDDAEIARYMIAMLRAARADALEEAAVIADESDGAFGTYEEWGEEIARAIRALKSKP